MVRRASVSLNGMNFYIGIYAIQQSTKHLKRKKKHSSKVNERGKIKLFILILIFCMKFKLKIVRL